jgi:hypothetical protein
MKTEIMQKIIEKQDDIIQVYYNQSEIYTDMGHEIVAGLLDELASLKSQLAEAGEEKKLTDEQIQQYVTDRFSDSHLLPEIIAFRAIKYYRLGLPPMNGNKAVLD